MRIIFIFAIFGIFIFGIFLGFLSPVASALTQAEFTKLLQEVHPFFQQQKLNLEIQKKNQKSYLGATDWLLGLNANRSSANLGDSIDLQNIELKSVNQTILGSSISRKFFSTGGDFNLGYQTTKTESERREQINSSFTKQGFTASYRQPLLKNLGGTIAKTAYDLAGYSVKIAKLQSEEAKENFLLQQLFLFLDWALFEEEYKITNNRLLLLKNELKVTKRKYKASFLAKVDLISQQAAVSNLELALLSQKSELADVREQLAALFQDKSFLDSKIPEINFYHLDFSIEKNLENYLKENSRILKMIDYQRQQNQRQQKTYQNQKKIQLDLALSASQFDEKTDTNSGTSSNYEVGLQFSLPLGNSQAKNQLASSLLELQQINYSYDSELRTLLAGLKGLETRLNILTETLALNTNQISLATQRTKEETRRYRQGHGSSSLVLQAQDDEQSAKISYAQIAASYHKIALQYKALLDKLLPTL